MEYTVRRIAGKVGREFIRANHYTRTCHNGPMCWGLFDGDQMIGVIAFATPSSEMVRASVFGTQYKDSVTELHRLFVQDGTPKNTESWFIARGLAGLLEYRPAIRGVISFADATEGHVGTVYQATNALYCGTTGRHRFYRDAEGRLRHPRQNGENITLEKARLRGWVPEMREAKHRYVFLIGRNRSERRWASRNLKLRTYDYPKRRSAQNDDGKNG